MKNSLFTAALLLSSLVTFAQTSGPQLTWQHTGNSNNLLFTAKADNATRYYLLEASRDSSSFEIVGRVEAKHYLAFASSYSFFLYDTTFNYYRLRTVDATASSNYSGCIATVQNAKPLLSTTQVGAIAAK